LPRRVGGEGPEVCPSFSVGCIAVLLVTKPHALLLEQQVAAGVLINHPALVPPDRVSPDAHRRKPTSLLPTCPALKLSPLVWPTPCWKTETGYEAHCHRNFSVESSSCKLWGLV